jgi:hypothetical protein
LEWLLGVAAFVGMIVILCVVFGRGTARTKKSRMEPMEVLPVHRPAEPIPPSAPVAKPSTAFKIRPN